MNLELFVVSRSCYMPKCLFLGLMVSGLHDMRSVCLLRAVTPMWVTNATLFTLAIDYVRYFGSLNTLQAKVKCLFSTGPSCLEQTLLWCHGPVNVYFMYFTWGW